MAIFTRQANPSLGASGYRAYLPWVRADFRQCCTYCLCHELLAGSRDNFELDHFRPKSGHENSFEADFFLNLSYACYVCNKYKAAQWPSDALREKGYRFVDPAPKTFQNHFRTESDGRWPPFLVRASTLKLDSGLIDRILSRFGLALAGSLCYRIRLISIGTCRCVIGCYGCLPASRLRGLTAPPADF